MGEVMNAVWSRLSRRRRSGMSILYLLLGCRLLRVACDGLIVSAEGRRDQARVITHVLAVGADR